MKRTQSWRSSSQTAMVTSAFNIQFDAFWMKSRWELGDTRGNIIQAVYFTADLAFEMCMTMAGAAAIQLKPPCTVITRDLVHDIVGQQPVQYAVQGDAIECMRRREGVEQFLMRQGVVCFQQHIQHSKSVRRRS